MSERKICNLCPLEKRCSKTLEINRLEISKFLDAFENAYPNQLEIASLENNRILTYTTSSSDKINRRKRIEKWLLNGNFTNDGFAYYLEFLLAQLIKQILKEKNFHDIQVELTPTELDCVHKGNGNGGDVIVIQGKYPLVIIDITIGSLSKKQNLGIHYPTGSPVIQFSIKQNIEDEICYRTAPELINNFSIQSINQGLYLLNGGAFYLPNKHLKLLKRLFKEPILTAAEKTLQKIQTISPKSATCQAIIRSHSLLTLIFES
ncbi:MAG: hypothetical protein N2558_01040 [Patescibacteria group bacterium]|nr:hypothetical protein [Patescibacteria group bacterium]